MTGFKNPPDLPGFKNLLGLILLVLFIVFSLSGSAQIFNKKVNQRNDKGQREGIWLEYWDENEKIIMSKAQFKDDLETGVCKNYHSNGKLRLKFRYHKNRLRVKMYDENRKLQHKGWAIFEINEIEIHYYWNGKWKSYNNNRRLTSISFYENGHLIEN